MWEIKFLQVRFLNDNESVPSTNFPEGNQFNVVQKEIVSIYNHEQSPSSLMIFHVKEMSTTLFQNNLKEAFVDGLQVICVNKPKYCGFFRGKNVRNNKNKAKMRSVQTCSKVGINLFIASQLRYEDLDQLFQYEISITPPSLFSSKEINIYVNRNLHSWNIWKIAILFYPQMLIVQKFW